MGKYILKFGEVEIKKLEFHFSIRAIIIDEVDTEKIIISDKFSCAKKALSILLATKIMEKLHHCVSCSQK